VTDLAERLSKVERDQSHPNVRPRDAATLILVDRSGDKPKVLLGRRHEKHVFMPGKFVFPGGRLDPSDRLMPVAAPLAPQVESKLTQGSPPASAAKARALALAAIRETFEETGLLLGQRSEAKARAPEGAWSQFVACGYCPDLSVLHFVARAITPPRRPRRFDTRFFSVDAGAIAHRLEGVVHAEAELVELVWLPIDQARTLDMPAITTVILEELEQRVAAGFGHDLPVPFYRMRHGRFERTAL
jgi:8-oxo-dGTP pyrophosphatase MutT (NUDIX family)